MKRKTLNLALGAVALGLVAVVFLNEKQAENAAAPKKGAPLAAQASDTVTRIALRHPDVPDITLEKKDGHWRLTAPVAAAADSAAAGRLAALGNVQVRDEIALAQVKRADLGLDPAGATLTLNDTVIAFGGVEPLKYTRYVETGAGSAADRIALIDDPQPETLDADYSDLISRELLPTEAEISAIELPGLSVKRSGVGPGWTTVPADAGANSDAVQTFVDQWRHARSVMNVASSGADAPAKPEPVTITLKDGSKFTFLIVHRGPQLVLERTDLKLRYEFAKDDAERLLKLPKPKAEDAAPLPADQPGAPPPKP